MGAGSLPTARFFRATPIRTSENTLLEHKMKAAITIDICSQSENQSFNLKYKEVTMTLAFDVV